MTQKVSNFFEQQNPLLKFIIYILTIIAFVFPIVYYPVKVRMREVNADIINMQSDHDASISRLEEAINRKMDEKLIEAKLKPLEDHVGSVDQKVEKLDQRLEKILEILLLMKNNGIKK